MRMLIGNIPGTIGETSVIAILIGAIFLILMGIIDLRIPGTYIVTFAIMALLFGGHGFDVNYLVAELCGGGLMLGAFFMATDYVTSPMTHKGQIIYGVAIGALTIIIRNWGAYPEGMSFAILIMNAFTPLINTYIKPARFGEVPAAK
jgi:Na+-translocating ferredoxin:NAD+ oxidoreductase RnfD subunit